MNLLLVLFATIGSVIGTIWFLWNGHNSSKAFNLSQVIAKLPPIEGGLPTQIFGNKPRPGEDIITDNKPNGSTGFNSQASTQINVRVEKGGIFRTRSFHSDSTTMGPVKKNVIRASGVSTVEGPNKHVRLISPSPVVTGPIRKFTGAGNKPVAITGYVPASMVRMRYTARKTKSRAEQRSIEEEAKLRVTKRHELTGESLATAKIEEIKRLKEEAKKRNGGKSLSVKQLLDIKNRAETNVSQRGKLTEQQYLQEVELEKRKIEIEIERERVTNEQQEQLALSPGIVGSNVTVLNKPTIKNHVTCNTPKTIYYAVNPMVWLIMALAQKREDSPEEQKLSIEQEVKLSILRHFDFVNKGNSTIGDINNAGLYTSEGGTTTGVAPDVLKEIVKQYPDLTIPEMLDVAKIAEKLEYKEQIRDKVLVETMAEKNKDKCDLKALNEVLQKTAFVDTKGVDLSTILDPGSSTTSSREESMNITQKVEANVETSINVDSQDRTEQTNTQTQSEPMQAETNISAKQAQEAVEELKKQLLQNPEKAEELLGKRLNKEWKKRSWELRQQELKEAEKQLERRKDRAFTRTHPEMQDLPEQEIRRKRKESEVKERVKTAREIYTNGREENTRQPQAGNDRETVVAISPTVLNALDKVAKEKETRNRQPKPTKVKEQTTPSHERVEPTPEPQIPTGSIRLHNVNQ